MFKKILDAIGWILIQMIGVIIALLIIYSQIYSQNYYANFVIDLFEKIFK